MRAQVPSLAQNAPAAQLPHVFEKFYQADNQRTASAKGTGLGLAIAKEIVEAHKGQIRCESSVGRGTLFTLLLPVSVQNRRRASAQRWMPCAADSILMCRRLIVHRPLSRPDDSRAEEDVANLHIIVRAALVVGKLQPRSNFSR